jgi:hypothetical protein
MGSELIVVETYAEIANREYRAAQESAGTAIQHAIACGEALIAAKASVQHGEWLPWLAANFIGSEKTAENWARLARNPQRVADMPSIRAALVALTEPKQLRIVVPALNSGAGQARIYGKAFAWAILPEDQVKKMYGIPG